MFWTVRTDSRVWCHCGWGLMCVQMKIQPCNIYLDTNNIHRGGTLYFFALCLKSMNSNPFQSIHSCKKKVTPNSRRFLLPCFFTKEMYAKHYLELFFQSCLSSYSWYEDAVYIAMQLIWRYFRLLSKNGFQQGIVDENVLLLKGSAYGSHWAELCRGGHLYLIPKIYLWGALLPTGPSLVNSFKHLQLRSLSSN